MEGFIKSFSPLKKRLKKYKLEIGLLLLAFVITIISFVIFFATSSNIDNTQTEDFETKDNISTASFPSKITTDIGGAVEKPGIYEVASGSRLKDILTLAGGLDKNADKNFFARNFNLARYVADQEKIYIPFNWEINSGIFFENKRTLDYTSPSMQNFSNKAKSSININTASLTELDLLTGVGKTTAEKIIKNRPYKTIEELLTRKVVNKSVFEKIKELISL